MAERAHGVPEVGPDLSGKAAVERLCGPRCATLPARRAASCFSSCANAQANKQPCTTECAARGVEGRSK
jgi:hypothetical protein